MTFVYIFHLCNSMILLEGTNIFFTKKKKKKTAINLPALGTNLLPSKLRSGDSFLR
jgi:hypothetical protein